MKKPVLLALLCSVSLVACLNQGGPVAKGPKIAEGRATMAKIGGRPLPVFEFSAKIDDNDNKIVGARVFVSTTGAMYKSKGDEGYELVEPKQMDAEFIANVSQVRATVDPAKEEALATHLNGDGAEVAFQVEIDWKAPDSEQVNKTRSIVYASDHDTIASAGLAKEIK